MSDTQTAQMDGTAQTTSSPVATESTTAQQQATSATANPEAAAESSRQNENELAKFRRLHEKAQKELDALKAEKAEREKSELSEVERLRAEASEAKARAEALERENLRRKVAQQHHLTAEATEFLTGDTEEELSERAAKLAAMTRVPANAGTTTNPAGHQQPSIDDRIAAASKAGDRATAITLMRQKAGLGRQPE